MSNEIFDTMQISATALSAERTRMNVIANNMANINTSRGPDGEPYRRKYVVFQTLMDAENGKGVEVSEIADDERPFRKVYKPGHPDADKDGYVSMPNVDMVEENVDLMAASRAYSANLSVLRTTKAMVKRMLDLLASNE